MVKGSFLFFLILYLCFEEESKFDNDEIYNYLVIFLGLWFVFKYDVDKCYLYCYFNVFLFKVRKKEIKLI